MLERCENLRIEPSAAAGLRGPHWLFETDEGRRYLIARDLMRLRAETTHVLWTTGGSLVPEGEYREFHERGQRELARELGA